MPETTTTSCTTAACSRRRNCVCHSSDMSPPLESGGKFTNTFLNCTVLKSRLKFFKHMSSLSPHYRQTVFEKFASREKVTSRSCKFYNMKRNTDSASDFNNRIFCINSLVSKIDTQREKWEILPEVTIFIIIIIISGFGIYGAAVVPDSAVGNTWQRLTLVLHEFLSNGLTPSRLHIVVSFLTHADHVFLGLPWFLVPGYVCSFICHILFAFAVVTMYGSRIFGMCLKWIFVTEACVVWIHGECTLWNCWLNCLLSFCHGRMHSLGDNGEGKLRGHLANLGSPGRWPLTL